MDEGDEWTGRMEGMKRGGDWMASARISKLGATGARTGLDSTGVTPLSYGCGCDRSLVIR